MRPACVHHEPTRPTPEREILGFESGLEAFKDSSRKLVEPVAEHESYNHLALIYDSQDEQFETVIPFITHGLECGEQCTTSSMKTILKRC